MHYYPNEHYAYWADFWHAMALPPPPTHLAPGAFGENLSATGLIEDRVNIGDIFALGAAVLQVSQPRSPCYKLNIRFGYPQMALITQTSGRTGWLFRVLQEGTVNPGDDLRRIESFPVDLTVRTCLDILYNRPFCRDDLEHLAGHQALSTGWRQHAVKRLQGGRPDRWLDRLSGKAR